MTDILGTPTSLSMRVSRKLSDNAFGSFEVSAELEVSINDLNLDDAFNSLLSWLEANVGKAIKAQKAAYDQLQPAADSPHTTRRSGDRDYADVIKEYGIGDERAVPPPRNEADVPVTPQNQPVAQSSGQMVTEVWTNPGMTVEFKNDGEAYLLIKGGKWTKHGAPAWAETLPFDISGWADRGETNVKIVYNLPDGLTEAVVQMNEKGQPKKVIEFR